jgi:hypothetical protein
MSEACLFVRTWCVERATFASPEVAFSSCVSLITFFPAEGAGKLSLTAANLFGGIMGLGSHTQTNDRAMAPGTLGNGQYSRPSLTPFGGVA